MSGRHATIDERELPEEMAQRFADVGLGRAPRTVGGWVDSTTELLESADVPTGLDAMCTADRDRHQVTIDDETRHVHCVLDALLVPFVVDSDDPVAVRSRSPESGEVVEIEVSREELTVSPETAVMSFGIAAEGAPGEAVDPTIGGEAVDPTIGGEAIDPTVAYELFCPYVNAFATREGYERWAEETEEAITVGLTMTEGHALARALEGAPTVSPDSH